MRYFVSYTYERQIHDEPPERSFDWEIIDRPEAISDVKDVIDLERVVSKLARSKRGGWLDATLLSICPLPEPPTEAQP